MSQMVESNWRKFALLLPFLLLFWVNQARHTLFFDEINAFAISAASPDLRTLFHYVRFEGHPWLWYVLLWGPSRLTHDPYAMKWVEAVLGTAILAVLGMASPFPPLQRALILSNYFVVWEYTVMNRMYSVMFLLTLLYLWHRARYPAGIVGNLCLLGLIGNTDATGILLSVALLSEYAYSHYLAAQAEAAAGTTRTKPAWKSGWGAGWLPGFLLYIALIALSVATLLPSHQISWQASGRLGSSALQLGHLRRAVADTVSGPWWPISPYFPTHFWDTEAQNQPALYVLAPFVLFAYWRTFRRSRPLLLLVAVSLAAAILFADVVYLGHVRHWGIAFISFLAGLWLQAAPARRAAGTPFASTPTPSASPWTYGLLCLGSVAGLFAITGSWLHPFSRARETAAWLQQNIGTGIPVVGAPDYGFASAAEEWGRPVYFMECRCTDTFKLFSHDREAFPRQELPAHLQVAMRDLQSNTLIFLTYKPLTAPEIASFGGANLHPALLQSFAGAETGMENFYIYRVSLTHPSPTAPTPTGAETLQRQPTSFSQSSLESAFCKAHSFLARCVPSVPAQPS